MVSRRVIFWDVDTQVDFVMPGGKLYVPGAEKLLPNLKRLTDAARRNEVFLVSDACVHGPDDEEFKRFPPHCLRGTPGAAIVPETFAGKFFIIPNRADVKIPSDLSKVQQVILEKQTLDVFDNPNTEKVIERLKSFTERDAQFFVFGVVTEYCVRLAAKGLRERGRTVSLVRDAVETLNPADGKKTLDELTAMGVRLVTTDEALSELANSLASGPRREARMGSTRKS
jgi:nicotinamidase/pyrazinamidase